jgi:hypothetical protein
MPVIVTEVTYLRFTALLKTTLPAVTTAFGLGWNTQNPNVVEPPAFGVALDDPAVASFEAGMREYWEHGPRDPEVFLHGFLEFAGSSAQLPSPLPPPLAQSAKLLMVERFPSEAVIPLDELRRAPFPKLVVSGAHSRVFDRVCDVLETRLDAERAVIPGAGHSVPRTGTPFNERLEAFLTAAEARQRAA